MKPTIENIPAFKKNYAEELIKKAMGEIVIWEQSILQIENDILTLPDSPIKEKQIKEGQAQIFRSKNNINQLEKNIAILEQLRENYEKQQKTTKK